MRLSVLLVIVAAAGAGCGTSDDRDAVRAATADFYAAVRAGDGAAACALMAEAAVTQLESQSGQACEDVVTRLEYEGGDVTEAEVFVTNARVTLSGGESAFLSLGPGGWRLTALACVPAASSDRPFDCEVEA